MIHRIVDGRVICLPVFETKYEAPNHVQPMAINPLEMVIPAAKQTDSEGFGEGESVRQRAWYLLCGRSSVHLARSLAVLAGDLSLTHHLPVCLPMQP